jgi:hypothetical protein
MLSLQAGPSSPNTSLFSKSGPSESQYNAVLTGRAFGIPIFDQYKPLAEELNVNVMERRYALYFHRMSCHLLLGSE